ncbi:hypothetical protein, partial [Phocaeicola plebeius]|uniref:hypothetical protein n=1 Tax=Phocaeicola plebeius TaxID=310297 RepID=UPI0020124AC1
GFFVSVLSVRLRPCPFPYLPRQAASSFCFRILSSLPFSPLLSFVPLPLTRTAFRNAPGDVFSEKENHSLSEAPDALRTGESSLRRETCFGKHGSESSGL